MSTEEVIRAICERGHLISTDGVQLKIVSGKRTLSNTERDQIKRYKLEIIQLLEDEKAIGTAMKMAIQELATICPEDLYDRLDWKLRKEKARLDKAPLDSVAAVELWRESWRTLIAEVLIDRAKDEVGNVR